MTDCGQELLDPATKTVLIVEDDDTVAEFLSFVVIREGFRVERAADGEEGLWKARNLSPDVILMDLMLPKFGGFDIIKELQTDETINTPVVIVTGAASEYSKEEEMLLEPNVSAFLHKPVSPPGLAALLHKLLCTRPPR